MANDVENILMFKCAETRAPEVVEALRKIAREVVRKKFDMGDHRTRWEPGDKEWRFLSPWGPAEHLQDELTRQLAAVDPTVVVTNYYSEEFGQAIGARITRVERKKVKAYVHDCGLDDRRARIVWLLQRGCEATLLGIIPGQGPKERVDLCDEGLFDASSARPRARITRRKSKKTRRSGK